MANRIQGITVQLGGDTTGLNKALSGTNKEISNTQKQLKDVERLLKLDPNNTELLAQKQKLLSQAVGETKSKLEVLRDAEKQVQQQFKEGKVSQEQYDALQREIVETEQSLKNLEDRAKSSNAVLSKIGGVAGAVAEKTKKVSTVAAGAAAGLVGMSVAAGKNADDINTLAKQTGLTTDQIQKFQYASDIIDVDLNTLTSSMAKLTRNMQSARNGSKNTKAAFDALGVSLVDQNGNLRNNQDVFNDTIDSLGRMENETQRDAYAMQIFGKSAQDLNPLILGGSQALKQMGEEAEEAGLILSEDALNGANEFNDVLDTLKAKGQAAFMKVGSTLAQALLPHMEKLGEIIGGVVEWFANLDGTSQSLILTILAVVAAISPVAKLIQGITVVTKTLNAVMAANPIVLIIGLIAALVAAFIYLWNNCEEFRNFWIGLWENVSTAFTAVWDAIVNFFTVTVPEAINFVFDKFAEFDSWLGSIFATDWSEQFGLFGDVINGFLETIKGVWEGAKKLFGGLIDFISGVFTGNWEQAWQGVQNIFGGIFDGLVAIVKAPINLIIGLINGVIDAINWIIDGINSISFDMPDWLGGAHIGFNLGKIGKIPYLAKGGILSQGSAVVGEAGPELLTMMGGRAVVQPLSSSATNNNYTGGVVINVYGAPGQNINDLTDEIMDRMESVYQRRAAVFSK